MISFGRKDPVTARDEKGFGSAFPVKHWFRATENISFGTAGTLSDLIGGLSIAYDANDVAANGALIQTAGNLADSGVTSGTKYSFSDTEDIVLLLHYDIQFSTMLTVGDILVGNDTAGGINALGKTVASPGTIITQGGRGTVAVTVDRSEGRLTVYNPLTLSDGAASFVTYNDTGFDGSFSSGIISTGGSTGGDKLLGVYSFVIAGFANGLPDNITDEIDEFHQLMLAGNKRLPAGWSPMY